MSSNTNETVHEAIARMIDDIDFDSLKNGLEEDKRMLDMEFEAKKEEMALDVAMKTDLSITEAYDYVKWYLEEGQYYECDDV